MAAMVAIWSVLFAGYLTIMVWHLVSCCRIVGFLLTEWDVFPERLSISINCGTAEQISHLMRLTGRPFLIGSFIDGLVSRILANEMLPSMHNSSWIPGTP